MLESIKKAVARFLAFLLGAISMLSLAVVALLLLSGRQEESEAMPYFVVGVATAYAAYRLSKFAGPIERSTTQGSVASQPSGSFPSPSINKAPVRKRCPKCRGAGRVQEYRQRLCGTCGGTGYVRDNRCPSGDCNGGVVGGWEYVSCGDCRGSGEVSA